MRVKDMKIEEFTSFISHLNDKSLRHFIKKLGYGYSKALGDFLLFNNKDSVYCKYRDCFHYIQYSKLEDIEDNVLKVEDLSNYELLDYYEHLLNDDFMLEEFNNANNKLKERIDVLNKNVILNNIQEYLVRLKIKGKEVDKLIQNNNYNAYDLLINLRLLDNDLDDEELYDLSHGNFTYFPNDFLEKTDNNLTVEDLENKIVLPLSDGIYIMDDYYSDYTLYSNIDKRLLDLETDTTYSRYKKLNKVRYN